MRVLNSIVRSDWHFLSDLNDIVMSTAVLPQRYAPNGKCRPWDSCYLVPLPLYFWAELGEQSCGLQFKDVLIASLEHFTGGLVAVFAAQMVPRWLTHQIEVLISSYLNNAHYFMSRKLHNFALCRHFKFTFVLSAHSCMIYLHFFTIFNCFPCSLLVS